MNLPEIMDSKDLACKKSSDFVQLESECCSFYYKYSQNLFENLLEKVRNGNLDTILAASGALGTFFAFTWW